MPSSGGGRSEIGHLGSIAASPRESFEPAQVRIAAIHMLSHQALTWTPGGLYTGLPPISGDKSRGSARSPFSQPAAGERLPARALNWRIPLSSSTDLPVFTLAAPVTAELEIRKSRFIAHALPVADRDAAMGALRQLRDAHPGATHVCWALLAGGQSGMSDDGEPSGTAGRPILEVLRHHDLDSVLGAVVRYYGGVKLGAGGLVRAYTDAIATALGEAQRVERIAQARLAVELSYADEARARRWMEQHDVVLLESRHGAQVWLAMQMPASEIEAARTTLRDLTQGRAAFPEDS